MSISYGVRVAATVGWQRAGVTVAASSVALTAGGVDAMTSGSPEAPGPEGDTPTR